MTPDQIKLGKYYIYPSTGIAVNAFLIKHGAIHLYPLNPNHDIGAGPGKEIPATEENTKGLIKGYHLPKKKQTP